MSHDSSCIFLHLSSNPIIFCCFQFDPTPRKIQPKGKVVSRGVTRFPSPKFCLTRKNGIKMHIKEIFLCMFDVFVKRKMGKIGVQQLLSKSSHYDLYIFFSVL